MAKKLYTLYWQGKRPTISDLVEEFGLDVDDFDTRFGVVLIDPRENLYAILLEEKAVKRMQSSGHLDEQHGLIEGPYSNTPIVPFGPVL